ncbi:MAG: 1-deoxy-D-xylulose-5-phosphate synthase, partial [Serratia liquefaciens]|nr:1-deoxy-D-xylulose-5-phosphate synthase [Serratia liquefaciens]
MSLDIAKYPTLALAENPDELRSLPKESLPKLCDELRQYLLDSVSRSSGHFASGLGTVELTVALH